jgi:phage terminase large subunit GpA-like protein
MTVIALQKYEPPAYTTIEEMLAASSEAVSPPERLTVTEAALRYVKINEKNYSGPWRLDKTPYLQEPQDLLQSLNYTGMVFVGPARSGKSQMWLNWHAYTAICDPADMMLMQMSMARAREFSLSDLKKLYKNSPEVRSRLVPGRQNDNVYDKTFLSGMRTTIIHPSINELSGKTMGRNWSMDYDRLPDNIDGEGDAWTLLKKRATTLGRYGMTVAESSPGKLVEDPKWTPSSPHEAPPCKGIMTLYNAGDRRRWQWQCPQCHEAFEPDFKLLWYPKNVDIGTAADKVVLPCPSCGFPMEPEMQYDLNLKGRWIREGETLNPDGSITGTPRRSEIASFWLKGPAAAFTDWRTLVRNYLTAEEVYASTGSEETLKTIINTDQGLPYISKAYAAGRLPDELKKRAQHYSNKGEVPPGVGFLVTTIDVQAGGRPHFVCHTFGIGKYGDIWHVDMWKITKSRRRDEQGDPMGIDPAAYPEDWNVLIDEVIERRYMVAGSSGKMMKVKIIACDSGGAAATGIEKKVKNEIGKPVVSVTSNAYEFWRRLRDDPQRRDYHRVFHLIKGSPAKDGSVPRIYQKFPDAKNTNNKWAVARGDVPVWMLNTTTLKDQVHAKLGRTDPGGQVYFPQWFDDDGNPINVDWLYSQLTSEVRTSKGWENPSRKRNEAFDLLAYCIAICLHPDINLERMDWTNPPAWANPDWDHNSMIELPPSDDAPVVVAPKKKSMSDLAGDLA